MNRVIKIFIGSSIKEFERERSEIVSFIYGLSERFEKIHGIAVKPVFCEGLDDAYSKIRKQDEYNEKVRESDLCFFLFFTKAGEFTREEFEVARKAFEDSGKPKIYTYFKELGRKKGEESLYDFMEELDKVFGHYYGTFKHIDTVKLRILLALQLQEMGFVEIKVEGDECIVDGEKALSLENVSEFANNQMFTELKSELDAVEVRYLRLKPKYESGECSADEIKEYTEIASKRQNIKDSIDELRKSIFNMSLRMCHDEVHGDITPRQREAYRLFEAGDLDGANRILDFSEIEDGYLRDMAVLEAEQKKRTQIFIRETKTKITVLSAMLKYENRFEEIEALYDKIVPVSLKFGVELDAVFDFVWFLWKQNKHQKAYEIAKKLEACSADSFDEEKKAKTFFLIGTVCNGFSSKRDETEAYYLKAIEIYEQLASMNPERFKPDLAGSYNNAGIFYKNQGEFKKAEEYYLKAIEIREQLVLMNPERFKPDLATSYNNAGVFYNDQGDNKKAEEYYLKAIEIYEQLASMNSERFNPVLAAIYNNAGIFYENQGEFKKAEEYYLKAIEIREQLVLMNPERFKPDLATSYNNAGIFYKNQGEFKKAEEYYLKAIEIREWLASMNPERFKPDLAAIYNNAGIFYENQGEFKKAEEYYLKAIEIREQLASMNPERFNPGLATSYNNAGIFYKNQGEFKKAEEYFLKAIEIREWLASMNPERFNPDLADSYNNAGVFYNGQGEVKKAEEYYLKAIEIREQLVLMNSERFKPDLAAIYNNAGNFYANQGEVKKAVDYYLKAIEIREELASINPKRFNPDLAVSYFNYGIFTKKNKFFDKALALAKTCPDNPYCKKIIELLSE